IVPAPLPPRPPAPASAKACPAAGRTARHNRTLIPLPPAPHRPIAETNDLGRLPPRDLLRHGSQNHFLYFHRPLHCGLPVTDHASHGLLPSPPAKRTHHVLSQPDISCANDTSGLAGIDAVPFRML